jgi:hypothetical protein
MNPTVGAVVAGLLLLQKADFFLVVVPLFLYGSQ